MNEITIPIPIYIFLINEENERRKKEAKYHNKLEKRVALH